VTFGAATDTDDASGNVIATSAQRPTDAEIEAALAAFRGEIQQIPPQYSAVKVDGMRAYDLAREGEEMDLAPRPLWVESLTMQGRPDPDHVDLEMVCGKGGYVRSIARDLGAALGCLGHVQWLRRTWSGPFRADQAVTLEVIEAEARTDALDARLLPLEIALKDLPEFPATLEGATRLRNGNPGQVIAHADWGTEGWASRDGQAIAIGIYQGGELHPSRVFVR
jgi:tRNA pseudouridine55 synthase